MQFEYMKRLSDLKPPTASEWIPVQGEGSAP